MGEILNLVSDVLNWRCLRDSQLEMTCVQVSIPERNLGKLKAAKGHVKSCDQICTGFNNSAPPIKEVPITSMRTE